MGYLYTMPVSLIPHSRRSFIQAGAVAALSPWGIRASAAHNTPWFAMLADPHIHADPAKTARETNMAENLKKVVTEILAEPSLPEFAFVNGDCAFNDGLKADYETFRLLVQPLLDAGVPVHLTMGNHDTHEPFYELFPEAKSQPATALKRQVSTAESSQAHWIFIDTLKMVHQVIGEIGTEQLQWISAEIDRCGTSGKPVIIVGHHYPQTKPKDPGGPITGLADTAEFMGLLRSKPQVKAYIFGHSHNYGYKVADGGVHLVNQPPVGYLFDPARPNGWIRGQLAADSLTLELRALDTNHAENRIAKTLAWR